MHKHKLFIPNPVAESGEQEEGMRRIGALPHSPRRAGRGRVLHSLTIFRPVSRSLCSGTFAPAKHQNRSGGKRDGEGGQLPALARHFVCLFLDGRGHFLRPGLIGQNYGFIGHKSTSPADYSHVFSSITCECQEFHPAFVSSSSGRGRRAGNGEARPQAVRAATTRGAAWSKKAARAPMGFLGLRGLCVSRQSCRNTLSLLFFRGHNPVDEIAKIRNPAELGRG